MREIGDPGDNNIGRVGDDQPKFKPIERDVRKARKKNVKWELSLNLISPPFVALHPKRSFWVFKLPKLAAKYCAEYLLGVVLSFDSKLQICCLTILWTTMVGYGVKFLIDVN